MQTTSTKNVVLESFYDFWRECNNGYTFIIAKGGRNSAKSTSISQRFIFDIIDKPINGLCIRKVGNTLQESVYEQLKDAINLLDVENYFEFYKSPLKIVYKPRGNYIIFRGADDPQKIKSIKTANFPIAIVWIEELSEFKTEDELQTITDSILRAKLPKKLKYKFFYSYNPPKRKSHWVNKKYETQFIHKNTYIHHSDYRDNHFLPEQTLEEIGRVQKENLKRYEWIYLGMPIGGGIVPFDNLVFRKIKNNEFKAFDNIKQGIDWGYAADPFAFIKLHYDKTRRKIYLMDEIYGVKLSNRKASEKIIKKKYNDIMSVADSAEPKSIDECRDYGLKIKGAEKGQGSVEYGEKWLDDLTEIVIDPERTPNAAKEFENIDYQINKDGNIINRLEDRDNHIIDSVRYSLESDMRRDKIEFLT